MFGFGIWSRRAIRARMNSLADVLEHVGVYDAERVESAPGAWSVTATAENVLLRLVEERDAYRDMVQTRAEASVELRVAKRNLAYARQARSTDRAIYSDALREAGREKGKLASRLAEREAELNRVLDVLIEQGVLTEGDVPGDGAEFDLAELLRGGCPAEEPVQRAEVDQGVGALTLREQAQLAIAAVCREDGSFNARSAFLVYSDMPNGKLDEPGWFWDVEGLRELGYRYTGASCEWVKREQAGA